MTVAFTSSAAVAGTPLPITLARALVAAIAALLSPV
jgi:hypothetical protein